METKILLADDHKILREGLRHVIEQNSGLTVVGEAINGREAIQLCEKLNPDIIIMDVAMEGLNGVEATREIVRNFPNTRVIALSMHSNKRFIIGMFKAGALGYLFKDCNSEELIHAIKTVAANQKYIAPGISEAIIDEFRTTVEEDKSKLSLREKEILQLIAEGNSSKKIAGKLFLSSKTIDAHRKNIMDKLELYTIPELTKYAIKNGLTTLDD